MAFSRPTLTELVTRIQADFLSRLSLVAPILRRAMVYVFSRVLAGAVHGLHGFLEWAARQVLPDTAERAGLLRFGGMFGVTLNEAAYATGNVVLTGTNLTAVPVGTTLAHADGAEYTTDAAATIVTLAAWANGTVYALGALRSNGGNIYEATVGGTSAAGPATGPAGTGTAITDGTVTWRYVAAGSAAVAVAVTASLAGEDGSRAVDVALSYQSPVAGADASVMVAAGGLSGGTDEEDIEDYRVRVLERMRNPPHGGNEADYVAWTKEVSGVTRAWCYPLEGGAGTVTVRFVRDDDASLIPDAGEVATVQAYLDGLQDGTVTSSIGGGPEVTAAITVSAPVADPMDPEISITPDTTATRAAVTAELEDLLLREAAPRGTLGTPTGTVLLSHIRDAIGDAEGVTDYTLVSPVANVTPAGGEIVTLGTPNFV